MELEPALLSVAAIAAAAAFAQVIARRLPIPVPLVLILVGILLGRDALHIVETDEISYLVRVFVALAVAMIVFEGATALSLRTLREMAPVVRNLVILGLILTPLVGMVAAAILVDFPWRVAALYGALVSVTGPSVISPLLQSVRVNPRIRSILMGEGVIIDPFGALLTFFLLQVALAESFDPTGPFQWVLERVGVGVLTGAAGAIAVYALTRFIRRMTSREVALVVIAAAVTTFAVSETLAFESGLTAMVVMGIALGTAPIPHRESLVAFQESIVAFLVSTVYVFLAAGIDLGSLVDLWPEGYIVVLVLAIIARPLLVGLSTIRSGISYRERFFLAAVAPRGVVAASLASIVAVEAGGRLGGNAEAFIGLVFITILLTIAVQSLYARTLARWLEVMPEVTIVAGYGEVGRRVAMRLREAGEDVLVVDTREEGVVHAREEGFAAILGDISTRPVLEQAGVSDARSLVLATGSDDRNLLAAQLARHAFGCPYVYADVRNPDNIAAFQGEGVLAVSPQIAVAQELSDLAGASPLSDVLAHVDEDVSVARVTVTNPAAQRQIQSLGSLRGAVVIMVRRGSNTVIPSGRTSLRLGDVLTVIAHHNDMARVRAGLSVEGEDAALARS
ncbi:MAG: cation:proton antiporter [Dehalococcoidia bacterium]|nr:cation:proton antiporter [Dehalococcoidia bacterium]